MEPQVLGAGDLGERRLRPEDLGAASGGELRGGDPDPARGRMDEQPVSFAEPAHQHDARVGGPVVDRNGGALLEAHLRRQRQDVPRGDRAELGMAAEPRRRHYPVTRCARLHPLPHRLDDAGDLVADDGRQRRRIRVHARPRHQVGEVDPRRAHAHAHLAGAGLGRRAVHEVEHLVGRAGSRINGCTHAPPRFLGATWSRSPAAG